MGKESYVLITPARDEEAYIEKTIESVILQTIPPKKWVVVSDGSTDHTDEIVRKYVAKHEFIQFVRLERHRQRAFSGQAYAVNAGYGQVRSMDFDFVGLLDADISFEANYYEKMLARFKENSRLGISGGTILENDHGRFRPRFGNSEKCVAGAIQLFRRQCYEDVGGYIPLQFGGFDVVANEMARMHGWDVKTYVELEVRHHRRTGTGEGGTIWRHGFRRGKEEYLLGYHPLFEVSTCLRRVIEKPYLLSSVLRMCGYCWLMLKREKRRVPADFVKYLRAEQIRRLKSALLINVKGPERLKRRIRKQPRI